jgi:hypothetical protein
MEDATFQKRIQLTSDEMDATAKAIAGYFDTLQSL